MEQTKLESWIEATVNIGTGFLISYTLWVWLIWYHEGVSNVPEPFILTSIFTVTSLLRSFFWRRFFNNGLHKAVHKLVKRAYA